MKSSHALILAVGLGIGGAMLNFYYLHKKSQAVETVAFVGIAPGVTVNPREPLLGKHLVAVPVPKDQAKHLDGFAVRYTKGLNDVVGELAPRFLEGGSLLLEQDLDTPLEELKLGENELAWPIPVDTRAFVPSLLKPGDEVWFLGAATPVAVPTPAAEGPFPESDSDGGESPNPAVPRVTPGSSKTIGPFTVLALGNRLGSARVMRAAKIRQVQENVMLIKVTMEADGSLRPPAQELMELLERTGSRPLGYLWRPRLAEKK